MAQVKKLDPKGGRMYKDFVRLSDDGVDEKAFIALQAAKRIDETITVIWIGPRKVVGPFNSESAAQAAADLINVKAQEIKQF